MYRPWDDTQVVEKHRADPPWSDANYICELSATFLHSLRTRGFDVAALHGSHLAQISTAQPFDRRIASRVVRGVRAIGRPAAFCSKNKVCPCAHSAWPQAKQRVRPVDSLRA